jgi:hypothetical protein
MRFSATCHTREGACAVVDPGTPVTFTSSLALRALIFDEEEDSGDGHGEGEPPDDPGDGQPGNGQPDSDGDQPDGDQPDGDQPDGDQGAGSDGGLGDSP